MLFQFLDIMFITYMFKCIMLLYFILVYKNHEKSWRTLKTLYITQFLY